MLTKERWTDGGGQGRKDNPKTYTLCEPPPNHTFSVYPFPPSPPLCVPVVLTDVCLQLQDTCPLLSCLSPYAYM